MTTIADDPYGPRKKAKWPIVLAIVAGVILLLGIATVIVGGKVLVPRIQEQGQITQSMNNLHMLATLHAERSMRKGGSNLEGKAFVLSPVATGTVDARNPSSVDVFFSPGDASRGAEQVPYDRWQEITLPALRAGENFDDCTSYAGPRGALTPDRIAKECVPILADLHFANVALVAFTDGSVRKMSREDLGLGPDDEIYAGEDSPSELLQMLSDE